MAPFKSSQGRNFGKLVKSYLTKNIGSSLAPQGSGPSLDVSGGIVVQSSNGIIYHIFTAPGAIQVLGGEGDLYYTIVAGGGSGSGYGPSYFQGIDGVPSTIASPDLAGGVITAVGGGGGGMYPSGAGRPGGSGGGAAGGPGTTAPAGAGYLYPGPNQQGFPGGDGGGTYEGGGGGGAGAVGQDATPNTKNGDGGDGRILFENAPDTYKINVPTSYGTPGPQTGRYVAGGGGAGSGSVSARGSGGAGGGGNGGKAIGDVTAGQVNTGGGGGGYENNGGGGGAGGGGAGGYISGIITNLDAGSADLVITVGAGGAAGSPTSTSTGGPGIIILSKANQSTT